MKLLLKIKNPDIMKRILFIILCVLFCFTNSQLWAQRDTTFVSHQIDTIQFPAANKILQIDTIRYISNPSENFFFQLQAGVSHSMSENVRFYHFFKAERPAIVFSVGKYFYPQFGLRLSLGWINQVSFVDKNVRNNMPPGYEADYSFNMGQAFLDGLFDLHSIFGGVKENRRFSIVAILGLGYLRTFGFSDMATKWNDRHNYLLGLLGKDYRNKIETYIDEKGETQTRRAYAYEVDTKGGNYFAGHVGFMANYKINDAWDINLEATFNGTDDAYNGVRCRRVYDSYVNVMAGVSYHIKDPRGSRRYRYSYLTDADRVEIINRTIIETEDSLAEAMKPIRQVKEKVIDYEEILQTVVEFYRDKTFITDAQKQNVYSVAAFMQSHPDINLTIVGYADVQTAYPAYNWQLSRQRAENVYNMLVNECGVDPNRLKMDWKGDTEQPFNLVNEWNRAVVFKLE